MSVERVTSRARPGFPMIPRACCRNVREAPRRRWRRSRGAGSRWRIDFRKRWHWPASGAASAPPAEQIRSLVRWDLLIAQALLVRGDQLAARRALREAITYAAPSRLVRTFIDEGSPICTLLEGAYDSDLEVLHPTDAFASELLDIFAQWGDRQARAAGQHPGGRFVRQVQTRRRREILSLVGSGMRNREVAQRVGYDRRLGEVVHATGVRQDRHAAPVPGCGACAQFGLIA